MNKQLELRHLKKSYPVFNDPILKEYWREQGHEFCGESFAMADLGYGEEEYVLI